MRRILVLVGLTLSVPILYLLASLILPLIPGPGPDFSGPPAHRVGLWQGAIHTDILLPLTPETRARFAFAEAAGVPVGHPDAQWLLFGWGSAAFYTTAGTYADITPSAVLTAATGDAAVIRLDVTGPLRPVDNIRFLALSEAQFSALLDQTTAAFASSTPLDHPGFTGSGAFFPAHGHFSALRTCNVWLGEIFRASGIPFGLWTPANWSVTLSFNRHLRDQTDQPDRFAASLPPAEGPRAELITTSRIQRGNLRQDGTYLMLVGSLSRTLTSAAQGRLRSGCANRKPYLGDTR